MGIKGIGKVDKPAAGEDGHASWPGLIAWDALVCLWTVLGRGQRAVQKYRSGTEGLQPKGVKFVGPGTVLRVPKLRVPILQIPSG